MQAERRVVHVNIEHGPEELDFPTHIVPVRVGLPSWTSQARGRVRLRIDMPAGPHPVFRFLMLLTLLFCVLITVGNVAARKPALDTIIIAVVIVVLPLATLLAAFNPFAKREVLVIDSRFVTLSRGDTIQGVWGRHEFTDVRVNDSAGSLFLRATRGKASRPRIVWGAGLPGSSIEWLGGAGVGLARRTAEQLLGTIEEFCDAHPAEEGFEYYYFGGVPLAR